MSQLYAEMQVSLLDSYLKLSSFYALRHQVEFYQFNNDPGRKSGAGVDQFAIMEDALLGMNLALTDKCSKGRWRAGYMPVINPLMTFNSFDHIKRTRPESFHHIHEAFQKRREQHPGLADAAKRTGPISEVHTHLGRPMKAYVAAYKASGASHFTRFSRHLRKQGYSNSPENELLLYLAHPLMRYDARQRFLEGRALPLLEVDILTTWAERHDIAMPATVASFASTLEGERTEDGRLNHARPDGARLTRQQIIDQCKALLPAILAYINELDVDTEPHERDYAEIFSAMLALFAAASLYDDPGILTLPEAQKPNVTLAFQRMAGDPTHDSLESSFRHSRYFPIYGLNSGFYPSLTMLAESLVETADETDDLLLPSVRKPRHLSAPHDFGLLDRISRHAQALLDPAALMMTPLTLHDDSPVRGDLPDLSEHVAQIGAAHAEWESRCHIGVYELQRFHLLADSHIYLPEHPIPEDTIFNTPQTMFAWVLPTAKEDGREFINMVELLALVISKFVSTPGNHDLLNEQVYPVLTAMAERLDAARRGVAFDGEVIQHEDGKTLTLPATLASRLDTPVATLRGDELREVASEAHRIGLQCRRAHIEALHLANRFYLDAQHRQEAMKEATAAMQELGDLMSGNAFEAIETRMAKLDTLRNEYREWCDSAMTQIMPFIEALNGYLGEEVAQVAMEDAQAAENSVAAQDASDREAAGVHEESSPDGHKEQLQREMDALREKKRLADAEIERQRQVMDEQAETVEAFAVETTQLKAQAQALSHHLSEAERGRGQGSMLLSGDSEALRMRMANDLVMFSESPTPSAALSLAASLYADRLIILDSAFESAINASDTVGTNILRRLLLLATEGIQIIRDGNPLYALNDVLPGDVACSESDTSLQRPKLRKERTFKETLPSGEVKAWVMQAHNWINYDHRLYFEYDAEREVFVIGHAGRHLQVASC